MKRKKMRGRHAPLKRAAIARKKPSLSRRLGLVSARPLGNLAQERPRLFRDSAFRRSNGLCVVSSQPADDAHHVIAKQTLRKHAAAIAKREGLGAADRVELRESLLWDPRNGVAVTRYVHDRHTKAVERIPRAALPGCAIEFAREQGLLWLIERDYPEKEDA